jgi:hypothetical protein
MLAGAQGVEATTAYSKLLYGPYEENHALGLVTIPSTNISFYGDYDGTTVTPICNGAASTFNLTINFCASNARRRSDSSYAAPHRWADCWSVLGQSELLLGCSLELDRYHNLETSGGHC